MSISVTQAEHPPITLSEPRRIPFSGIFELTVRCNLQCRMCLFRHNHSENTEIIASELSAAQWIDMARQAAEAGTMRLLITGGEPMLRPDFCEIWEGIYNQGFLITLYTNASLVTPKIMDTLRKYPPHKIGITIYGASPETYQKVCGNADAFENVVAGVHQLETLPSILEFRSTIIKENYHDHEAITAFVQREFDPDAVVAFSTSIVKAVRGGCADVGSCRMDPLTERRMHLDRKLKVIKEFVGDEFSLDHVGVREPAKKQDRPKKSAKPLGCAAAFSSYAIAWDGKMLPCQMFGLFQTDAKALGFQRAWQLLPSKIQIPPPNLKCASCDVSGSCETCYATRFAETGSVNGCSDYIYQSALAVQILSSRFRRNKI